MRSGLIISGLVGVATLALAASYVRPVQILALHTPPASYSAPASPFSEAARNERILLSSAQTRQARASGLWPDELHSVLSIDERMKYGDFVWNDDGVPLGQLTVRIDLQSQLISVFRAGHEIGTAVILYGADEKETPLGTFPILWKRQDHRSSLYDAPMPYTLRLTGDGIAIHGSDVRWGAATHGCIGVPTEFAAHLFDQAKVGDKVLILRTEAQNS